jgi:catechol 2,3-dioxygenase-like lactoylglutathione lyase family enzyme
VSRTRGIVWTGVQTERFDEMERFLAALLDSTPSVVEDGFRLWTLPSGDLVELFAPGRKPTFGPGPVVGFQVVDLEAARRAVEDAGGTVVGGYGPNADGYTSLHLRAPDGNVYEIVHDPDHTARAATG